MKHILRCQSCGNYALRDKCKCGGKATITIPARFSPEDAYGSYRRKAKLHLYEEKGLI